MYTKEISNMMKEILIENFFNPIDQVSGERISADGLNRLPNHQKHRISFRRRLLLWQYAISFLPLFAFIRTQVFEFVFESTA